MFIIENLAAHTLQLEQTIQAVANIELLVQSHDAWTYQTLCETFAQDSIHMLIVYQQEKTAGNKVVGYCLYQILFEQAEILRIGVHPNHQRQGIASQIFAKLNIALIGSRVESLLLEVRADNAPAIALYEQQEFIIIHKRKGYYQVPHQPAIDALIMQRVYD